MSTAVNLGRIRKLKNGLALTIAMVAMLFGLFWLIWILATTVELGVASFSWR